MSATEQVKQSSSETPSCGLVLVIAWLLPSPVAGDSLGMSSQAPSGEQGVL